MQLESLSFALYPHYNLLQKHHPVIADILVAKTRLAINVLKEEQSIEHQELKTQRNFVFYQGRQK